MTEARLPLAALLSQALVAFTLEFDNEFERQMREGGFRGIGLSLTVWSNLLRFLSDDGMPVRELSAASVGGTKRPERTIAMLGCLERWGFISFDPSSANARSAPLHAHRRTGRLVREGYGSGRGIRGSWLVRPTGKGQYARAVWPPLFELIEGRWQSRFGEGEVGGLRASLHAIVSGLDLDLPEAIPQESPFAESFPPRLSEGAGARPLPTLLSQALLGFAIDFKRESVAPLALCANLLRVVTEQGVRVADLARLTGGSPEVSAIGWRAKRYLIAGAGAQGRGRIVRFNALGLNAHRAYPRLLAGGEARWSERFGATVVGDLSASLRALFHRTGAGRPRISEGLVPPAGVRRSGDQAVARGLIGVVPAERKRTREMAAQTAAFIEDPSGTLPHFPMWDMNRGFGP